MWSPLPLMDVTAVPPEQVVVADPSTTIPLGKISSSALLPLPTKVAVGLVFRIEISTTEVSSNAMVAGVNDLLKKILVATFSVAVALLEFVTFAVDVTEPAGISCTQFPPNSDVTLNSKKHSPPSAIEAPDNSILLSPGFPENVPPLQPSEFGLPNSSVYVGSMLSANTI